MTDWLREFVHILGLEADAALTVIAALALLWITAHR